MRPFNSAHCHAICRSSFGRGVFAHYSEGIHQHFPAMSPPMLPPPVLQGTGGSGFCCCPPTAPTLTHTPALWYSCAHVPQHCS